MSRQSCSCPLSDSSQSQHNSLSPIFANPSPDQRVRSISNVNAHLHPTPPHYMNKTHTHTLPGSAHLPKKGPTDPLCPMLVGYTTEKHRSLPHARTKPKQYPTRKYKIRLQSVCPHSSPIQTWNMLHWARLATLSVQKVRSSWPQRTKSLPRSDEGTPSHKTWSPHPNP